MAFDKQAAYLDAKRRARQFIDLNDMRSVMITKDEFIRHYGLYQDNRIYINVKNCRVPSSSRFQWSWPGYKADLTPLGVVAHELGHHWHFTHPDLSPKGVAAQFGKATKGEPKLTSYEPNTAEAIAESFKLFFTNPDLLRELRPLRYRFFRSQLEPIETREWDEVLEDSARHVEAVCRQLKEIAKHA